VRLSGLLSLVFSTAEAPNHESAQPGQWSEPVVPSCVRGTASVWARCSGSGIRFRRRSLTFPLDVNAMRKSPFLALVLFALTGCETSRELGSSSVQVEPARTGHLDMTRALEFGKRFAQDKGWLVLNSPSVASFDQNSGEWSMRFRVMDGDFKQRRDVIVNDNTHEVRYSTAE